jgi:hypothetical protein
MTNATLIKSVQLTDLPALGTEFEGGIFAGVTTQKDGTHCAVVLLTKSEKDFNWQDAMAWAKEQDAELPTRPMAALLFANVQDKLQPEWHWTADEYDASSAWVCYFDYGFQYDLRKSYDGAAVAVRLIPLTA